MVLSIYKVNIIMMRERQILKGKKVKVRILRPSEYELFREGIGNGVNRATLEKLKKEVVV